MSRDIWNRWLRQTPEREPLPNVTPDVLAAWLDGRAAPENAADIERLIADDPNWLDLQEDFPASLAPADLIARAQELVNAPRASEAQSASWWSGLRAHFIYWRPAFVGTFMVALALWVGASMGSAVIDHQRLVETAISAALNPGFRAAPAI